VVGRRRHPTITLDRRARMAESRVVDPLNELQGCSTDEAASGLFPGAVRGLQAVVVNGAVSSVSRKRCTEV